jgi:hypothetical protein
MGHTYLRSIRGFSRLEGTFPRHVNDMGATQRCKLRMYHTYATSRENTADVRVWPIGIAIRGRLFSMAIGSRGFEVVLSSKQEYRSVWTGL